MLPEAFIVILAAGETLDQLRAQQDRICPDVPVRWVEDEAGLTGLLPPNAQPRAYLLHLETVKKFSPALVALLAARPISYPPVVVFGSDFPAMRRLMFSTNSMVEGEGEVLISRLCTVVHYWTKINSPLD
jgi:hypothetical protein